MMKTTTVAKISILSLFWMNSACAAHENLVPAEVVSEKWESRCHEIRSRLLEHRYSNLLFNGSVDIARLTTTSVDAFGINVATSLAGQPRIKVSSFETGANISIIADSRSRFIATNEEIQYVQNYWDDDSTLDLSKQVFGDNFSLAKHAYAAFEVSPIDLECKDNSRFLDAKIIALINLKTAMWIRSEEVEAVFDISKGDWQGYAYCFNEPGHAVVDFSMTNDSNEIHGTTTIFGRCDQLPMQKPESTE